MRMNVASKVVTCDELVQAIERVRQYHGTQEIQDKKGKAGAQAPVVASTNGCFDILHVGHLRYLQAARDCGDLLVVALNSDASIQRLKGAMRPIVPQVERAELLAGLACVDYVVIFDEDTPDLVLKALRPDVHAKGAQYTAETLPEAPMLQAMGTRLEFITMVPGQSTTNIVERIQSLPAAESSESCAANA